MFSETKFHALDKIIPEIYPELIQLPFYFDFLYIISHVEYNLYEELKQKGYSRNLVEKSLKPFRDSNTRWCRQIFSKINNKYCHICDCVLDTTHFPLNRTRPDGLGTICKECHYDANKDKQPARTAKRKAALLQRIPKWSELTEIAAFYDKCPVGYQVDHILPLQGTTVSGLHVLNNLQYLTIEDNIRKSNKIAV